MSDDVDIARVVALADLEPAEYRDAVLAYLDRGRPENLAVLFRYPSLRRKTLAALGKILKYADKHGDRHGAPREERERWRRRREAARAERNQLVFLAKQDPGLAPTLRRIAYGRLADEFPQDWADLIDRYGPQVSPRRLVQLTPDHAKRYLQILREEREKAA